MHVYIRVHIHVCIMHNSYVYITIGCFCLLLVFVSAWYVRWCLRLLTIPSSFDPSFCPFVLFIAQAHASVDILPAL